MDFDPSVGKLHCPYCDYTEEIVADEVKEITRERLAPFNFSMCNISVGEEVEFARRGNPNDGVKVHVVDNRHVSYDNQVWSLTSLAKFFMGTKKELAGPQFFKYNGEWLNDIRMR